MGNVGKSLLKGLKYTGLYLGAASVAVIAQPEVLSAAISGALVGVGVPPVVGGLVGSYAVPVLASALAGAVQQIVKHRDKVFEKKPE